MRSMGKEAMFLLLLLFVRTIDSQSCVAGSTWSTTGNAPCTACTTCTGSACTISSNRNCSTTASITRSPASGTIYWQDSVTFTATITRTSPASPPYPTGTVDFKSGTNILASGSSLSSSGVATYSTTNLPLGSNTITVLYPPQPGWATSTNSVTLSIAAWTSTTTLSFTPTATNSLIFGSPVIFNATVTTNRLPPTGDIQFKKGATVLATIPLVPGGVNSSSAIWTTSTLPIGSNAIVATLVPPPNVTASSSSTQTVTIRAPTTTIITFTPSTPDMNSPVTLTANVSSETGVPSGNLAWKIGVSIVSTTTVTAGIATLTVTLEPGNYSFSAQFVQSTSHFASTSSAVLVTIPSPAISGFALPAPVEGPFTTGCYLQEITPGGGYIWHCALDVVQNLVITADTSSGSGTTRIRQFSCLLYVNSTLTQTCGFVFKPAGYVGPKELDYMWISSTTSRRYPGTVANLVVTPTPLKYSGDQQDCTYWPLWRPPVDYQYCMPGLDCYFKNVSDLFIGEVGRCWYPRCSPLLCSNGARFMQDGYCNYNTNLGQWQCEPYRLPGDNCTLPSTNQTVDGWGIHPVCSPFQSFCLPANWTGNSTDFGNQTTGVCVRSSCLDGGCRFGTFCSYPGTGETAEDDCRGNAIPLVPLSYANAFLDYINPALSLPLLLQSTAYHLQSMDRIRSSNPRGTSRRNRLFATPRCTSSRDCSMGSQCTSLGTCSSATVSGCSPTYSCGS